MRRKRVRSEVNETPDSLIHTLDSSIETFARIRSSDAMCVAAFDTLKQARAMIARALDEERRKPSGSKPARESVLV